MRKVLLTVDELVSFGGAQMVVVELVEWFAANGWFVEILTRRFGSPVEANLTEVSRTGRLTVHQDPNEWLDPDEFDLVWITHSLFPRSFLVALAGGRRLPAILWCHLGSLDPLEAVNFLDLELATATRILVVSPRTRERMVESGLPLHRMVLFDNPTPADFRRLPARPTQTRLGQILLVSNHPPDEVLGTRQGLAARGINLRHIGQGGEFEGRVTPELLATAGAVITIGKTTQYCLVMGIPVYSYDHFGGVGWINSNSYLQESAHNFSGYRTQRKLTPEGIVGELAEGFWPTLAWAEANRRSFARRYSLEFQMERLLNGLGEAPAWSMTEGLDFTLVERRLRERWSLGSQG